MKNHIPNLYAAYEKETDEKRRLSYLASFEEDIPGFLSHLAAAHEGMEGRPLAYALARISMRRRHVPRLLAVLGENPTILPALIGAADAKTRKNTYILLGNLAEGGLLPLLLYAAETEETLFALPSLILALGNHETSESAEAITQICCRVDACEDVPPRLAEEIRAAAAKAQDRMTLREMPRFGGLIKPRTLLLTVMGRGREIVRETLAPLYTVIGECEEGFLIEADDTTDLSHNRCYEEALLWEESICRIEGLDAFADAVAAAMADADLCAMHETTCLRYRITVRGRCDKHAVITALCRKIRKRFGDRYQNSPAGYALEIIVNCTDEIYSGAFGLRAMEDGRFAYRRETIPASVSPATAGVLCALAKRYAAEPATVLDPFCGAGTLLAEARFAFPAAEEFAGVDISRDAIRKCRVNTDAAGMRARLVTCDILKYQAPHPYDLVISNMPFGIRVGNHRHNMALYAGFSERLPSLLSEGGIAVLYTTDAACLRECLEKNKGLKIVAVHTLESGGLMPKATVVKRV